MATLSSEKSFITVENPQSFKLEMRLINGFPQWHFNLIIITENMVKGPTLKQIPLVLFKDYLISTL